MSADDSNLIRDHTLYLEMKGAAHPLVRIAFDLDIDLDWSSCMVFGVVVNLQ